jgi:hypothetical protein
MIASQKKATPKPRPPRTTTTGRCLCGAVELEIDVPVFWAWHDHSKASRLAHGAVYATYVGVWRSKVRITKGGGAVARFKDEANGGVRSFCSRCGSPLIYERSRSPKMVNLPRALFTERTGREPRYHIGIDQLQDWAYGGQPLVPLKGYPGVMQERPRKKRKAVASLF